ncbi:hypothetical protein HOY80DRAFT_1082035 [Tuber brumale]|nr:hypothetical protein HOY80DRAFT_1082035 [Tuber brumale]
MWGVGGVVEAEEVVRKGELVEITGQRPPGPDGNALPGARGRSGLRNVVVTGPMALKEKALRLLGDTLFIPRVPDIYFKNVHYTPDASTKNRAQLRRLQPDHRYRQTPPESEVTRAFLKAWKKQMKEGKKVTRLQKELEVSGRHAEVLARHEEEKEWKLQEKAMAKKEARVMDEKIVQMHREGNGTEQRGMQIAKTD